MSRLHPDSLVSSRAAQSQPFGETFAAIARGRAATDASATLADVVAQVRALEQPGTVTITLKVAPYGQDGVNIDATVVGKPPKVTHPSTFFIDDKGRLTRNDPNQAGLFPDEQ